MEFVVGGQKVDSVELKCLVVSRGLKIDREVYQKCGNDSRIDPNALTCNCFRLPDGTIDMTTDYRLALVGGQPTLLYRGTVVTPVELMPA